MILNAVNTLISLLQVAVLLRVLYSWVDPSPYPTNEVKRILWAVTDPLLEPLRRVVPPLGMLDITPLVALVLLQVVQRVILQVAGPTGW